MVVEPDVNLLKSDTDLLSYIGFLLGGRVVYFIEECGKLFYLPYWEADFLTGASGWLYLAILFHDYKQTNWSVIGVITHLNFPTYCKWKIATGYYIKCFREKKKQTMKQRMKLSLDYDFLPRFFVGIMNNIIIGILFMWKYHHGSWSPTKSESCGHCVWRVHAVRTVSIFMSWGQNCWCILLEKLASQQLRGMVSHRRHRCVIISHPYVCQSAWTEKFQSAPPNENVLILKV